MRLVATEVRAAGFAMQGETHRNSLPLVRKRIIPTELPPLVGEIIVSTFADRGVSRSQRGGSRTVINLSFLERSRYFSFK
jgi:hypothetical protein